MINFSEPYTFTATFSTDMNSHDMPVEEEKFYVRFNLSGRMVWSETPVMLIWDIVRELDDIPLRGLAAVLYAKIRRLQESHSNRRASFIYYWWKFGQ